MSGVHPHRHPESKSAAPAADAVRYPTNHVVAIVDTADQARAAWTALTGAAFLESEVTVTYGQAAAEAVAAATGRSGLTNLAMRVAERFGVVDDEMAMKERYEQALKEGHFVVAVLAPTEERKELAGRLLRDHGARFVHYMGRFSIEPLRD